MRHPRSRSGDPRSQKTKEYKARYEEIVKESQKEAEDESLSFGGRFLCSLGRDRIALAQDYYSSGYHANRAIVYGKDALSDIWNNQEVDPYTKEKFIESVEGLEYTLAGILGSGLGAGLGKAISKGAGKGLGMKGGSGRLAPKSSNTLDALHLETSKMNRSLQKGSSFKVSSNQNRFWTKIVLPVNSNQIKMQKTGTGDGIGYFTTNLSSQEKTQTLYNQAAGGSGRTTTTTTTTTTAPVTSNPSGNRGALRSQGGDSAKLTITRDRQGRVKGVTHTQNHHIISNKKRELKEHPLWEKAGMDPEASLNKMLLPTKEGAKLSTTERSIHQGRHSEGVHKRLLKKMEREVRRGERENWVQPQYQEALRNIIKEERKALKSGDRILNKHHRPWAKDQG